MLLFPVAPVTDPTQLKSQSPPAPPRSNFPLLPRGGEGAGMRGPEIATPVFACSHRARAQRSGARARARAQRSGARARARARNFRQRAKTGQLKKVSRIAFGASGKCDRFSVFGFRVRARKQQRRGSAICQAPPRSNFPPFAPAGEKGRG